MPEFHRGDVWNHDQARGLFDLRYIRHLAGVLLGWETESNRAIHRGEIDRHPNQPHMGLPVTILRSASSPGAPEHKRVVADETAAIIGRLKQLGSNELTEMSKARLWKQPQSRVEVIRKCYCAR